MLVVVIALGAVLGAFAPWPGLRFTESASTTAARLLEHDRGSGRGRIEQHRVGLAALRESPWLGVGPGGWDHAASSAAHAVAGRHTAAFVGPLTPNSDLLRITVEQGIAGVLLLALAIGVLLKRAVAAGIRGGDPLARALIASLGVAGIIALLDAPLTRPDAVALLAIVAGLVPGGCETPLPRPAAWAGRLAMVAFAVAACARLAAHAAAWTVKPDESGWESAQARAFALYPRSDLAERLAVTRARNGRCSEGEEAARAAEGLGARHWGTWIEVSRCHARAGRVGEAARLRAEARAREPHVDALLTPPTASRDDLASERD